MTPAEIQRELEELETRLERLRIKYDQYFTGIEKMLPFVARKDVDRRFQSLHREQMRNTGLRFRFQTLVQRFTSYQTYWNRITRQIEEGTFRRDVVRAQRMGAGTAAVRRAEEGGPQELNADELEELEPEPEAALALVRRLGCTYCQASRHGFKAYNPAVQHLAALHDVLLYGQLQPLLGQDIRARPRGGLEKVYDSQMVQVAYEADTVLKNAGFEIPLFW